MRSASGLISASVAIAVGTLLVKLWGVPRNVYPDRDRLQLMLEDRIAGAGFTVARPWRAAPLRLSVRRGRCAMIVQQLDVEGAETSIFARRAAKVGPVRFLYRGTLRPDFPRAMPVLRDQLQRQAARLGISLSADPIIGVASTAACPDPVRLFEDVVIWPWRGPPTLR